MRCAARPGPSFLRRYRSLPVILGPSSSSLIPSYPPFPHDPPPPPAPSSAFAWAFSGSRTSPRVCLSPETPVRSGVSQQSSSAPSVGSGSVCVGVDMGLRYRGAFLLSVLSIGYPS